MMVSFYHKGHEGFHGGNEEEIESVVGEVKVFGIRTFARPPIGISKPLVNKCELLTNKSHNLHVYMELYLLIL